MNHMLTEMRDRMKARVGVYETGWNPSSMLGLVLPIILVLGLIFIGWLLVSTLG